MMPILVYLNLLRTRTPNLPQILCRNLQHPQCLNLQQTRCPSLLQTPDKIPTPTLSPNLASMPTPKPKRKLNLRRGPLKRPNCLRPLHHFLLFLRNMVFVIFPPPNMIDLSPVVLAQTTTNLDPIIMGSALWSLVLKKRLCTRRAQPHFLT